MVQRLSPTLHWGFLAVQQDDAQSIEMNIAVKGGRTPHVSRGIFEIPLSCSFVGDRKKPTDVCPRQIVYELVHFFKIGE